MSWAIGYDDKWKRWVGYGVVAFCDFPRCNEVIDRGLAHVCCGEEPKGGEKGCGLYFCGKHQDGEGQCSRCRNYRKPFDKKPEHPVWLDHLLRDDSWADWRTENPKEVAEMRRLIAEIPPQVLHELVENYGDLEPSTTLVE